MIPLKSQRSCVQALQTAACPHSPSCRWLTQLSSVCQGCTLAQQSSTLHRVCVCSEGKYLHVSKQDWFRAEKDLSLEVTGSPSEP